MTTTLYPLHFKEEAVRMLLRERRDAATLSRLLGIPTRTLLDWQTELRTEQPTLYQEMVGDSHTAEEPAADRPVISYTQELEKLQGQLRRLLNINRTLRLGMIDLQAALMAKQSNRTVEETRRILRCWFKLPALWRLAAAVYAGLYTPAELQALDPNLDLNALQIVLDDLASQQPEPHSPSPAVSSNTTTLSTYRLPSPNMETNKP